MVEISDQELAQLRECEGKYRAIIELPTDGIIISDKDGNVDVWNAGMVSLTGIAEKDAIGLPLWKGQSRLIPKELATPELLEQLRNGYRHILEAKIDWPGESREQMIACADGTRKIVQDSSFLIKANGIVRIGSILRDITERKQAEMLIKDSEERLRIIFEDAPDAYYLSDLRGNLVDGNKVAEKTTGYKKEDLIGKSFLSLGLLSMDQVPKAAALLARNLLGQATGPDEFTLSRKDGSRVMVEISTYPVKIKGQSLVLGIARDITGRKLAEKKMKESEQEFRSVFDNAGDGILIADPEKKKFVLGNKAICRMLGYSPEEITKLGVMDIHPEKDIPFVIDQFERQVKGEFSMSRGLPVKRKDGAVFYADVNATTITIAGKTQLMGFFHDVSERMKAEEELAQKVKELEKTTRIMEGREDRIIELKARVKELEGRQTTDRRP